MNTILSLSLVFFAGIANGSFALPIKYTAKWKFENIWLNYAAWAFVIFPWFVALYLTPHIFKIYANIPGNLLLTIVIGGGAFGIGQMCFALAIDIIGMGLGFLINLGISIGLGFALPLVVQYPQKILTPFGFITLVGVILAITGLIISSYAGMLRNCYRNIESSSKTKIGRRYVFGVVLAVSAGLSSASQNFVFSYTHAIQALAIQIGASDFAAVNIIWPIYLSCSFIPYMFYMLYLHHKNNSFDNYNQMGINKYYIFAIIMGAFWYGSVLLYCKASQLIGYLGPIIDWPLFMVLIILSSNFWGWKQGEWRGCGVKAKNIMKLGLGFLIISTIVLGYSSTT